MSDEEAYSTAGRWTGKVRYSVVVPTGNHRCDRPGGRDTGARMNDPGGGVPNGVPGVIYMLHFDSPIGDVTRPRMSARHYVGWAKDGGLEARLEDHWAGKGAAITRWAVEHGIGWTVVMLRDGSRLDERRLKNIGNHHRRCSICTQQQRGVWL